MARFQLLRVKVSWPVLLAVAHFTYLLVGATIFQILEREAESNSRTHFQMEKLNFLANYTCLDGPALEKFVQVGFFSAFFLRFVEFVHVFLKCKGRKFTIYNVSLIWILD